MAGQYRTSTDLVTEALANLGVLVAGQATDPEDFNYVNEKLDAIFRYVAGVLEIVSFPDPNNIPGIFFAPLADIVAGECALKFGVTADDYVRLKNAGLGGAPNTGVDVGAGTAAKALKIIMRNRSTSETLQTEYL